VNEIMVLDLLQSYCLPRLMYGCEIWPLKAVIVREIDVLSYNGFRHVLTAVGRKVLSHFSFIVTTCRYLINYRKTDDYSSVIIIIVLRTLAGLPRVRFEMLQLHMMLMTYITQLKLSRMPCSYFVNSPNSGF